MYSLLLTFLNALSKECEARNFVQPRNTDIMVMVVRLHITFKKFQLTNGGLSVSLRLDCGCI